MTTASKLPFTIHIETNDSVDAIEIPEQRILTAGHHDLQSAFVLHDYPYGRHLRCPMLYWIERGERGAKAGEYRMMRCSPKKVWCEGYTDALRSQEHYSDGLQEAMSYFDTAMASGRIIFNKPKASTYSPLLCMVLGDATDGNGEVITRPNGITPQHPYQLGLGLYSSPADWLVVYATLGTQVWDIDPTEDTEKSAQEKARIRDFLNRHEAAMRSKNYYAEWWEAFDKVIETDCGVVTPKLKGYTNEPSTEQQGEIPEEIPNTT